MRRIGNFVIRDVFQLILLGTPVFQGCFMSDISRFASDNDLYWVSCREEVSSSHKAVAAVSAQTAENCDTRLSRWKSTRDFMGNTAPSVFHKLQIGDTEILSVHFQSVHFAAGYNVSFHESHR